MVCKPIGKDGVIRFTQWYSLNVCRPILFLDTSLVDVTNQHGGVLSWFGPIRQPLFEQHD